MAKVKVQKIDLDTVGVAFLLGASRADEVEVLRSEATAEDLANPDVICIEVGGSGQPQLNNWDHHKEGGPTLSAAAQVLAHLAKIAEERCPDWPSHSEYAGRGGCPHCGWDTNHPQYEECFQLVEYIDQLDTKGPEALRRAVGQVEFPTLSDVFSGMLLTTRDPVEQLHKGVELLKAVVDSSQNPYGTIKGFDSYAAAKAENNRQIAETVENARWETTSKGLKLGVLETNFFGAPGALYGVGAQVVVCLNPNLNGVRKFTIAGNSIRVDAVAPTLKALEPGWGGPPTGTILGSPWEGSKLSLEEVAKIVKTAL